jgi:hypothetical protein
MPRAERSIEPEPTTRLVAPIGVSADCARRLDAGWDRHDARARLVRRLIASSSGGARNSPPGEFAAPAALTNAEASMISRLSRAEWLA